MDRPGTTPSSSQPVFLDGFNGMWSRGAYSTTPLDHLNDCFNCAFPGRNQVGIRQAFVVSQQTQGAPIWYFIARLNSGDALITLGADGFLRDETNVKDLIFWGPDVVDGCAAINLFGRMYICATFHGRAVDEERLYYYDGTYFLPAAGFGPPADTIPVLSQTTDGNVDPGLHGIAVAFVYRTGYISPPGRIGEITSDGTHNIHIDNIPIGGSGVVGRVLLISKSYQNELFFMPGGSIDDNTTTSFDYNGFDTGLIVSADWLFDVIPQLPSCSALRFYKGRMLLIGQGLIPNFTPPATPDIMLVSEQQQPEDFSSVRGIVTLPKDNPDNACSTAAIIRDIVYVMKPYGTYAVQDNGDNPDTWPVSIVDSGIGAYDHGLSVFNTSGSAQDILDTAICINKRGLMYFNGTYSDIPLSYKLESIWQRMDQKFIYNARIAHNVQNKVIYLALPLIPPAIPGLKIKQGGNADLHLIFIGDYKEGLAPMNIKWSCWTSGLFPVKHMVTDDFNWDGTSISYDLTISNGIDKYTFMLKPTVTIISGTVNVSNNLVTFVSGANFSSLTAGDIITISGLEYDIADIIDAFHLMINGDAGIHDNVTFTADVTIENPVGDFDPVNLVAPIDQYIISAVVSFGPGVNVFTMLDLDVQGHGPMGIFLFDKNRTIPAIPYRPFDLTHYGNMDLQRKINFMNEGLQIMLRSNGLIVSG